jgi:integrating conjugative element protein (TIGR03765 family)
MIGLFQLFSMIGFFMFFFSINFNIAYADTDNSVVDGQTYGAPNNPAFSATNIQLSQDQIQQLTDKASSLQPLEGGFKPLTTTLKECTDFKSKHVNIEHLAHPLFVVGDDQASINWIIKYKDTLEKLGAVGLVINAENLDSLKHIRSVSGDLDLHLANGDELGKMFGIDCYPVLISKNLIEH